MGYIVLVFLIFIGELLLKDYMEEKKTEDMEKPVCKGHLLIRKYHNKGAMLNLGQKRRKAVALVSLIFTALTIPVFLGTLTLRGGTLLKTGLALLLGGAFSNTYDRMKRKYVVDYVSFQTKIPGITAIVFNISDFCIAIGAAMAAIAVCIGEK